MLWEQVFGLSGLLLELLAVLWLAGLYLECGLFFLSVCVGIAGAVLGGWLFVLLCGVSERMESLSLAVSAVVCAIFLWAFSCITGKDNTGEC